MAGKNLPPVNTGCLKCIHFPLFTQECVRLYDFDHSKNIIKGVKTYLQMVIQFEPYVRKKKLDEEEALELAPGTEQFGLK